MASRTRTHRGLRLAMQSCLDHMRHVRVGHIKAGLIAAKVQREVALLKRVRGICRTNGCRA